MRNEGGGFAVNSNGAMPACIIQTPNLKLEPRTLNPEPINQTVI